MSSDERIDELQAEVERLRLTDDEVSALKYFADVEWTVQEPPTAVLRGLLERIETVEK